MNDEIFNDWLEFKTSDYATREIKKFVNIKRDQISEVIAEYQDSQFSYDWCTVVMKNGNKYAVNMPYEKVMKLV